MQFYACKSKWENNKIKKVKLTIEKKRNEIFRKKYWLLDIKLFEYYH